MGLTLSLDVGTTSLKAALFDPQGRAQAVDAQEYSLIRAGPEMVEAAPEVYWNAARKAVANVLSACGEEAVKLIGVTGQGETLVPIGRNGAPVRRAIVWLDNRSRREADELGQNFGIEEIHRVTGMQEVIPTWTATKLLWLRRNEPQAFRRTDKFLLAVDYLTYMLTGRHLTDCAMNPSTLYFDIRRNRWWTEMLDYLGVSEDRLPSLTFSGEEAFPISPEAARQVGLPRSAMVTTAPLDQISAAIGAGNIEPGMVTETTGAALAICATFDKPVYDPGRRAPCHTHGLRGKYALLAWAPTAGMALRWFRDELGGDLNYDSLCSEASEVGIGADGLMFLPYLSGAGCPDMDPAAKGVFLGLSLGHRRAHFTRAILESVAFVLRRNLEFLAEMGADADEVRALGGGARSDLWLKIKANMLGKSMVAMECEESACLGAAMLSYVAGGTYRDLAEAKANMVRISRTIEPDAEARGAYAELYDRYLRLNDRVSPLFRT